jgi:hypothetical protein
VALDRQSIEKRDFPIGRRGYEPQAVDAHLAELADQIERLERSAGRSESVAELAGGQVKAIVEVAESTAAQITADAERQSKKIIADARKEVRSARDEATREAADQVAKISQAAAAMLERIDAMEQEANSLIGSVRTGADRIGADLRLLEGNLGDLKGVLSAEDEEAEEPEVVVAAVVVEEEIEADDGFEDAGEEAATEELEDELVAAAIAEEATTPGEPAAAARAAADEVDDVEGARLIALNMALNGNSRQDIDRYLEENFDLGDREALLDEVYASVEG